MRVISVDDEKIILEDFVDMLSSMHEIDSVEGFTDCDEALEYVKNEDVDVAFLDIHMRGMDGIELAKRMKVIKPGINIVFLTAYAEYSMQAMKMHASGYIMKPASEEDVRRELEDLRRPVQTESRKRLRAQCFGNFEVYIDNMPCTFRYIKTKELIAYLIDRRGAYVTNGEILGTLWEDKEVTPSLENYLRNLVGDMRGVFKEADLDSVILKKKGMIAIVPEAFDCDYYRWIDGDVAAINAFSGEYMSQYSWSEYTLAGIESRMEEDY
ncbi:MAG: response regulator [Lachnospiraceae bacterium]|nr:response regulator [Lachnospiraceae bacterium]